MSAPRRSRRHPRPLRERAFHRWLAAHLPAGRPGPGALPLGDDAAALRPPPGRCAVLTTDALVEGTHFLRGSPPGRIGEAAAAVSLSDAAAKGARPAGILIALMLPPGSPERWARAVVLGAERMGGRYGAHVVGGDTKPSPVPAVVSTVIGWARAGALAPRMSARPGDLVVTTGRVGSGGAAWRSWRRGARARPRRLLADLLSIRPRVREGIALAPHVRAMLDTSDGIAEAAWLLAEASRVRVVLEERSIPWDPRLGELSPARRARAGFFGGDYELLAALPPAKLSRARRALRSVGGSISIVGRVERGRDAWWSTARGLRRLPRSGWQPWSGPRRSARREDS